MPRRPPRSTARFEARRAERRLGLGADGVQRATIAQAAARLIAEHGLSDWSLAKRKAARQLDLPERAALPNDEEIEEALREHHALFGGEAHAATLRAQREEALVWMKRLAAFRPLLVGGVAEGWATEHSDIRLELTADDPKGVELALLNGECGYRTLPARLRMNVIARPGVDKVDFELWSLAVSAINGCGMCLDAHERELRKAGIAPEAIQAAVRDTRRWLAGEDARDLRRATAVVTRMVTENLFSSTVECRDVKIEAPRVIEADAILTGMGTEIPAVPQGRRLTWRVVAIDI